MRCEVEGCRNVGQRHHVIFRSQGGLDIDVNYKYLCAEHHTGKKGPHGSRTIDLEYKCEVQNKLFELFQEEEYVIGTIAEKIGYDRNRLQRRFKAVPQRAGIYKREDVVRALMGGRLY